METTESATMSVSQAANLIGLSRHTIYRLLDDGHLQSLQHVRHKRITRASINAYLAQAA